MAHPYHHSVSSARKWGGEPEDYQPIHDWFDQSKELHADFRHRALRHHAQGIFECERVFGTTLVTSSGRAVPVRWVGEQHVKEDLGYIPSFGDWAKTITAAPWMSPRAPKELKEIAHETEDENSKVRGHTHVS